MDEYEAKFEIDSKTDAYAVEKLLTRLYNALREETRTVRKETADSTEMLEQFKVVRDAAQDPKPGTLTVKFEQEDSSFDD
ncbi:hypothetical protein VB773_03155 [Haloarculaceae archaeon H-GB2-1]|nr:hypothetical protein [Haloarculaceae archaeon H-GB1-1]MEA5388624.1 hypothetical protein [Haloarculaceae archaeon H-GB11]MEA5406678.1 hypothetical protein [Haloarculaceae archaeon H-GB2-1]